MGRPGLRLRARLQGGLVDLVVRGGTVVLESGPLRADVLLRGGKVAGLLTQGQPAPAHAQSIDASGALVLPGGVDAHPRG